MESKITGQALVDLKKEVSSFNNQLKRDRGQRAGESLDKDAFLKLLTIQMSKQDPLSPLKNTEFVAQMAQFTSLEQMKNMNSSMDAVKQSLAILPGFSMIGKEISFYDEASESYRSGLAESISLGKGGAPMIVVSGQKISLENITSVKEAEPDEAEKLLNLPLPAQPQPSTQTTAQTSIRSNPSVMLKELEAKIAEMQTQVSALAKEAKAYESHLKVTSGK